MAMDWSIMVTSAFQRLSKAAPFSSRLETFNEKFTKDSDRAISYNWKRNNPNNLRHERKRTFLKAQTSSSLSPNHNNKNKKDLHQHGLLVNPCDARSNEAIVQFTYPKTNTSVTVIGCLHGAASSANDVQQILLDTDDNNTYDKSEANNKNKMTTMIVLELCTSRFANIRRELESRKMPSADVTNEKSFENNWNNFWSIVSQTTEKRGLSTGIAAAVLGGFAGLQTLLSGLENEPGIEFITAMKYAEQNTEECDIILADRNVDETLRQIGAFPSISLEMLKYYIFESKFNWNDAYGELSNQLIGAIWGMNNDKTSRSEWIPQIDMGKALIRDQSAIQDLVRLTLPPLVLAEVLAYLFNSLVFNAMNAIQDPLASVEVGSMVTTPTLEDGLILHNFISGTLPMLATEVATTIFFLFVVYILIALPAAKLVLIERDEPLANGIKIACQLAAEKSLQMRKNDDNTPTNLSSHNRVVAVVGLLHVNGIVQRLLHGEEP